MANKESNIEFGQPSPDWKVEYMTADGISESDQRLAKLGEGFGNWSKRHSPLNNPNVLNGIVTADLLFNTVNVNKPNLLGGESPGRIDSKEAAMIAIPIIAYGIYRFNKRRLREKAKWEKWKNEAEMRSINAKYKCYTNLLESCTARGS